MSRIFGLLLCGEGKWRGAICYAHLLHGEACFPSHVFFVLRCRTRPHQIPAKALEKEKRDEFFGGGAIFTCGGGIFANILMSVREYSNVGWRISQCRFANISMSVGKYSNVG